MVNQTLTFDREVFNQIFPFYIELDPSMMIKSLGVTAEKLLGDITGNGFLDVFEINRPHLHSMDFETMRASSAEVFIFTHQASATRFRGQWIIPEQACSVYFVGSPWIQSLDDLRAKNLHLSDFAIHDPTFDFLHIIRAIEINADEIKILMRQLHEKSELLRKSEENYRETLFLATDVIYKFNEFGFCNFANPAAERVTGFSIDELLRMPLNRMVRLDMRMEIESAFRRQFEEGISSQYLEFPIINKWGAEIWFGQSTQLRLNNGKKELVALAVDITAQKQAAMELSESNRKLSLLQTLIDNTSDAIQIAEESGWLYYVNEVASQRLGIDANQCHLYKVSQFEAIFENEANWVAHVRDLEKQGQITIEGKNINQSTGETFPVEVTVNLFVHGGKRYIIANSRDISERKNNEKLLNQELKLQEALIDIASTFINLDLSDVEQTIRQSLERMGRFVGADRAYIFDYHTKEKKAVNTYEWCDAQIAPAIDQLQDVPLSIWREKNKVLAKGEPFIEMHDGRDKKGASLHFDETLAREMVHSRLLIPLLDERDLVGAVGFEWEVSNHQHNDKELRLLMLYGQMLIHIRNRQKWVKQLVQQESKFRNIIANMNLGLIEVDLNDVIQFANQSFSDISGYSMKELVGKKAADLLLAADDRHIVAERQLMREKGIVDSYEIQVINKKGERRWWLVSGAAHFNDRDEMIGTIGIHLDISDQKKLERELANAKSSAEAASKAKELFLANMSHEIRTPLNVIIGMIRQLNRSSLSTHQLEFAQHAGAAAKHLLTIINNVLDMAKIDSGQLTIEKAPFDLRSLMGHVYQMMHVQAVERGIQFSLKIAEDVPTMIEGDETRMRQVLINLIGNAIKFTSVGEVQALVRLVEENENTHTISFQIVDTGVGMSEEFIAVIFEKFTQENIKSNRKFEGTGLGMAISRDLMTLMGGTMDLISTKGLGTTVTCVVPFQKCQQNSTKATANEVGPQSFKGLKALLVEDNHLNRFIARQSLSYLGFEILEAANGQIALDTLETQTVDLILMDIQMPVMDGVEATRILRSKWGYATPIIALTANAVKNEIDRYLEEGMNDFVTKPYDEADLFYKIGLVLDSDRKVATPAKPTPALDNEPLFDLEFITQMSRGDQDIVQEMIRIFAETAAGQIQSLEESIKNRDFAAIAGIAHQMKPGIKQLKVGRVIPDILFLESLKTESTHADEVRSAVVHVIQTLQMLVDQMNALASRH